MKHYYLAALCLFCLFQYENAHSQNLEHPCGSDYWQEKNLQDPVFFQKNLEFEQGILQVFQQKKTFSGLAENMKVIPVVVHIIHDGGPENLSDAQAQQAITWLNQALANQGSFNQGSGADCGIQLCLAQRTPDGQSTNGITRNQSPFTEMQMESQDFQVKNLNRWKPKDYVNIWLVRSICSSIYGCNVYGYANYPSAHGSNMDGIVIEAAYLAELGKIRSLAHEMGHYLGLYHTFEGGCENNNCLTDGDRICDTPPDQSIASVPCTETVSTCSTDTQSGPFTSDQPDMSWNFMDYGILACFHDYTPDQATRMNATLDGVRRSLLDSKGCLPPCPAPTIAGFMASATTIAMGETVSFSNTSQNAGSFNWTVNGIPFGSQANAAYTFSTPGTYTVLLTVQSGNSALCDPDDAQVTIQVYCPVTASFTASDLAPEQNDTIILTNTSQNALQTTWFVNGVNQGATLDSIAFSAPGVYEIRLETGNGVCGDTATELVYVQTVCVQKTFEVIVKTNNTTDYPGSLTSLTDGNLLLAGIEVKSGDESPIFIKMKPDGQVVWAKELGLDSTLHQVVVVRATPDGGFIGFYDEETLGIGLENRKSYLVKFTANGILSWAQTLPIVYTSIVDVLVNADGSILISGPFLAKFTSTGILLWSKKHIAEKHLASYPDGGFLALDAGALIRFDQMGNTIWRRSISVSPSISNNAVVATPNGDIYIAGYKGTVFSSTWHATLLKLNPEGETVWGKIYREIPVSSYQFEAMTLAASGNLIIAGYAQADGPGPGLAPFSLLMEIDLDGNVVWSRHRPNAFHATKIVTLPGGGIVVVGHGFRILKTDDQGLTIGCAEEPFDINIFDLPITNLNHNPTYTDTLFLTKPVLLPVNDLSWHIDTLCSPACLQPFEICNNKLDDDGDGLFDCLDPECPCEEDHCAPKQANIWYFGHHAGLDFSNEPPTVLSAGMTENFGISATMSDQKGNLIFYADGNMVYNRFHQPMPNGDLQVGSDVSMIILPHPENSSIYYVFYSSFGSIIYYSVVDMTLEEGRGDVAATQKNLLLVSGSSGLAAVKSCSFKGYWLLIRRSGNSSDYWAFRLDENGINNLDPVQSNTGQAVGTVLQMKISPDGKRVACAAQAYNNSSEYLLTIHDFDPSTNGLISNSRILGEYDSPNRPIGVEFSTSGRYLYVTGNFDGLSQVLQFDLEAGSLADIQNSRVVITTKAQDIQLGYPQIAPNRKIYLSSRVNFTLVSFHLDIIHQPDLPGLACQYQPQGLVLNPSGGVSFGLCNFISSYFPKPHIGFPSDAPDTICELNTPIHYQIQNLQCGIDSITWQTENLSAQIQPNDQLATIRYLAPGAGRLIVTAHTFCGRVTDTLDVLVTDALNKTLELGPDLLVCSNGVFSFNAGSGFARYQWSDGTAGSTTTTLFPGKYWVNVWDLCGNFQTDSITVSIASNSVLALGPDLPQQCSGYSANYQRPANFDSWKWSPPDFLSCTDCPNVTITPTTSATWVVVAQTTDGCISVDTLSATIRDTLLFSRDTVVCVGQTLALFGAHLPADTTAQIFLQAPGLGCDTLLTVNVLGIENSSAVLDTLICPNAFFDFNGTLLPADTVAVFHFSNALACDSTVTVTVHAYPPLNLVLPMDTTIRVGASVILKTTVTGTGTLDFLWSPVDALSCTACPDPLANPLDTITYTLAVTDGNGCTAQKSVTLRVNEECRVRIPNAFTANGDGSNDLFRPITDPCVRTVRLWKILNRWGQTVLEQINFPAADLNLGWDGNWGGKAHPSDVLIWVAEFEYYDGRREVRKGEVTLVR